MEIAQALLLTFSVHKGGGKQCRQNIAAFARNVNKGRLFQSTKFSPRNFMMCHRRDNRLFHQSFERPLLGKVEQ